jgi:chromosomal replication initiation ATPase DnaA
MYNLNAYSIPGLKDMGDLPPKKRKTLKDEVVYITCNDIFNAVSEYSHIPITDIKRKTRKTEIVYARKLSVYLMRIFTELTLKGIGNYFETLNDHTSVRHAYRFILKQITGKFPNHDIQHDLDVLILMIKGNQTIKHHNQLDN